MANKEPTEKVTFFDAEGNPTTDSDGATSAEIVESVDGVEIRRHYLNKSGSVTPVPEWEDPGGVLTEPDVVDHSKKTWDVWIEDDDGQYRLVATLDELRRALGIDRESETEQRRQIGQLTQLPVWQVAPQRVRDEAAAWLNAE